MPKNEISSNDKQSTVQMTKRVKFKCLGLQDLNRQYHK